MTNLPFSDDVLQLNPELAKTRDATVYRVKRERVLKASDVDGFESDLERDYFAELSTRPGWHVQPHGWTFHLPGGVDYTPDFIAWSDKDIYVRTAYKIGKKQHHVLKHLVGAIVYEVKGAYVENTRESRAKFKIAAGLYPWLTFVWVTRAADREWIEKHYQVKP